MEIEKREPMSQLLELLDRVLRGGVQVQPWLRAQPGGIALGKRSAAPPSIRRIPERRRKRAA